MFLGENHKAKAEKGHFRLMKQPGSCRCWTWLGHEAWRGGPQWWASLLCYRCRGLWVPRAGAVGLKEGLWIVKESLFFTHPGSSSDPISSFSQE